MQSYFLNSLYLAQYTFTGPFDKSSPWNYNVFLQQHVILTLFSGLIFVSLGLWYFWIKNKTNIMGNRKEMLEIKQRLVSEDKYSLEYKQLLAEKKALTFERDVLIFKLIMCLLFLIMVFYFLISCLSVLNNAFILSDHNWPNPTIYFPNPDTLLAAANKNSRIFEILQIEALQHKMTITEYVTFLNEKAEIWYESSKFVVKQAKQMFKDEGIINPGTFSVAQTIKTNMLKELALLYKGINPSEFPELVANVIIKAKYKESEDLIQVGLMQSLLSSDLKSLIKADVIPDSKYSLAISSIAQTQSAINDIFYSIYKINPR
jgi:hypothetical protein